MLPAALCLRCTVTGPVLTCHLKRVAHHACFRVQETSTLQKSATPGAAARLILRFPFSTDLQQSNRGDQQNPSHLICGSTVPNR